MALLPPVFVELKANASEFMSAMDQANKKVESLGNQGATVGQKIKEHLGAGLMAGGAAATAAGGLLLEMGEKVERSQKDLEVAIDNTGASYEEYGKKISAAVNHEEKFGHTADDSKDALAVLTRATGDAGKALEDMDLVTQIAAVHHSSLAEAANMVAKMHAGSTKALKEFGINVKDNAALVAEGTAAQKNFEQADLASAAAKKHLNDIVDLQHHKAKLTEADHLALRDAQAKVAETSLRVEEATKRLDAAHDENAKKIDFATEKTMLLSKIHGTAEAQADTFGGKIAALKAHFTDMAAVVGQKVGPALVIAGPAMAGLGAIIQANVIPAVIGYTGAMIDAAVATAAALWPVLLVVAAVATWAAEIYLVKTYWQDGWEAIKAAGDAAWQFLDGHLVQPFLGAFHAIAAVVVTAKDTIAAAIDGVLTVLFPLRVAIEQTRASFEREWVLIQAAVHFVIDDLVLEFRAFMFVTGIAWGVISATVRTSVGVITDVVGFAVDVWREAWAAMSAALGLEWGVIRFIVGVGAGFIEGVFDHVIAPLQAVWASVWSAMSVTVVTAWDVITGGVKGGINGVIAGINFLISALDAIQIHIPSIGVGPFHTPSFDWDGLHIAPLPELREMGGPVYAGRPYIVGEKRAELFVPSTNGRIEPSVSSVSSGGGDTIFAPNITVHAGMGTDGASVARQVVEALREYMRQNGPVPITTRAA